MRAIVGHRQVRSGWKGLINRTENTWKDLTVISSNLENHLFPSFFHRSSLFFCSQPGNLILDTEECQMQSSNTLRGVTRACITALEQTVSQLNKSSCTGLFQVPVQLAKIRRGKHVRLINRICHSCVWLLLLHNFINWFIYHSRYWFTTLIIRNKNK